MMNDDTDDTRTVHTVFEDIMSSAIEIDTKRARDFVSKPYSITRCTFEHIM